MLQQTMNRGIRKSAKFLLTAYQVLFLSLVAMAQNGGGAGEGNKDVNMDVNLEETSEWYTQWWIWVVGLALFIIIIVAIARGGGSRG